jgi:lysozyme family protein
MNTQELDALYYDTRSRSLQALHNDTFEGANYYGSWDLIRKFYDITMLHGLHFSDSDILDPYAWGEAFDYVKEGTEELIREFYNVNDTMLDEKFTLNNNFYPVDLRVFIVDLEYTLRKEKRESKDE